MATSASNRGTLSRHPGRFQVTTVVSDEADTARLTRYHREQARSIITHNQSPDLHFDSSMAAVALTQLIRAVEAA